MMSEAAEHIPDGRAIGVFDSGVGGLTVLHECLVNLPHEDFIYLGDTALADGNAFRNVRAAGGWRGWASRSPRWTPALPGGWSRGRLRRPGGWR